MSRLSKAAALCFTAIGLIAAAPDHSAADYASDAVALDTIIAENYAYLDTLPGGVVPQSPQIEAERAAVHDADSLLHYAEDRIASLADHHAITGRSFRDSWAVVPTYADLWIMATDNEYIVDAVRSGSVAAASGIAAGDRLTAIDSTPTNIAVANFWARLGLAVTPERASYAARVLASGRRDRPRRLTFQRGSASARTLTLANLYGPQPECPAIMVDRVENETVIHINNSLGDQATIAAFDEAMALVPANAQLVIDLTYTPSGGNSSVARAILGWFVTAPQNYQVHNLPTEQRETGIARQWVEQVLPRPGQYRSAMPIIRVGRWTGSMGEGIAIGFAALGARVEGERMAGLRGAVYDVALPSTGLVVKLPVERLYAVDGTAREGFVPQR